MSESWQELTGDIAKRRKEWNMSQEELGNMIGVSRTYISMLETGKADNPSYNLIMRLMRVLGRQLFDRPERRYMASCYVCGTKTGLEMLPHRKENRLVGWIFACSICAPYLYGADIFAKLPAYPDMEERIKDDGTHD